MTPLLAPPPPTNSSATNLLYPSPPSLYFAPFNAFLPAPFNAFKCNKLIDLLEELECLKAQASQVGTEVGDDELFLQVISDKNKKGTVYELGAESEAYYPRPGRCSGPSSSYTPSIVSQMETRLKKSREELQTTGEELRATREEQKQQRELIASLLARLEGPSSSHSLLTPS
ncbi:hypothetical protein Cgig2_017186 [Carnegiea gigantea]|uniref:Uncharacterized protein n=1 Tax=Carnegiea gigantea TaxID=171969 RepID=A0A9Q1Q6R3_9CARY|nr:hypothetical protein Cgig2_017186 [Carnegiea gigantea]